MEKIRENKEALKVPWFDCCSNQTQYLKYLNLFRGIGKGVRDQADELK